MKEWLSSVFEHIRNLEFAIPAAFGGLVDFLERWQSGRKPRRRFVPHMLAAMFFGWLLGTLAFEYTQSVGMVAACGGLGGFLGPRLPAIVLRVISARR